MFAILSAFCQTAVSFHVPIMQKLVVSHKGESPLT